MRTYRHTARTNNRAGAALLLSLVAAACTPVRTTTAAVEEGRTASGIAYDVRGAGPAVVLIHGAVLDRRMWDHEASNWATHFRVVRYDLRGHGQSADIGEPYSPLDDLAAVLDATGVPRAHVVGLSKGSQVALDFAIAHPDRVDRLVLAGAAPSGFRPTERVPGTDSLVAALRRGDIEAAGAVAASMPAFAAPPDRAAWIRSIVMANARLFRQSPTAERPLTPPALGRLREVGAPTLIVVGERDSRDVIAASDSLARGIQNARRVTVPDAGHLVNVYSPDVFDRVVRGFLSEGTAGSIR
jgi:pimeloyl-ACP methyl ester carboxylesterase